MTCRSKPLILVCLAFLLLSICTVPAASQSNSRLLLTSGSGVPGIPGFTFGPFSGLAMNASGQIAFLSTIQSERNQRNAIIRSEGVSFSVAVFQGLVSPIQGMLFNSFSPPAINASGNIAFTANLTSLDNSSPPSSGVFLVSKESVQTVASAGQNVPGASGSFREFSAPVIASSGAVVFGAQTSGSQVSSGLYLWTSGGIRPVGMPTGFQVPPNGLLVPVFQSEDESVWALKSVAKGAALDQFFRAVALKNFEQLNPPPDMSTTVTVLAPAADEKPVNLLLVVFDGEKAETAEFQGDPTQAVLAKTPAGPALDLPFGQIQGQAPGSVSGTMYFAAAPAAHPDALGFYSYQDGQVNLLDSPQDPSGNSPAPHSLAAMSSNGKHTLAFIAPGPVPDSNAIYVTSLP